MFAFVLATALTAAPAPAADQALPPCAQTSACAGQMANHCQMSPKAAPSAARPQFADDSIRRDGRH